MPIHSISILASRKQYVNLPTELLTKIRQLFGPNLATAWEVFYTESRRTGGVICKTYDYLARKIGCSRRTAIRYVKKLIGHGVLVVKKRFKHNCNIDNEFVLLSPEQALLASKDSNDRVISKDINIDYSVDYLVENSNSVDKSVTFCHPSISDLNQDINNRTRPVDNSKPKTAITACRQEKEKKKVGHDDKTLKSVPVDVIRKIEKIIKSLPGVSNPRQLAEEAIHFVANRKDGYSEWRAVGAFKRILNNNGWSTPSAMRKK